LLSKSYKMSIETKQAEIIEEFSMFDEWMEKYEYIIELGRELPLIEEQYKSQDNLIKGCQSQVWLHAEMDAKNKVQFSADSDAIITKGIISMLVRVLTDSTPEEIIHADLHFINDIGLHEHLSPTRSNGLLAMIKQMKYYGLAIQAKKG